MVKLTAQIKSFIDAQLKSAKPLNYSKLRQAIKERYGVQLSKATLSKRAKALGVAFRPGRRRLVSVGKRPAHTIFLDCAGAFFLKGAELEMGLPVAMKRVLGTSTESEQARKALELAQQINAILLYAPLFELKSAEDIAGYSRRGLLYLSGQKSLPSCQEITQYLGFLGAQRIVPLLIKEVLKVCAEALCLKIDFGQQNFYLDGQMRTVWPDPQKIPENFGATLNKITTYIRETFESPSAQRPLILQNCPGYTFLPTEMFNLIKCLEQAHEEPIAQIVVMDKSGNSLKSWQRVQPPSKCFFLAPLSPWQYARLPGTKIVRDFQQYQIGPQKELMSIAEAKVILFDSQLHRNIEVRAAMVRRKEERLVLITNIAPQQERYIRRIAELYFCRWPTEKLEKFKNFFNIMEEAHEQMLGRPKGADNITPLRKNDYNKNPEEGFLLFLEYLHRYARMHFFPSEYAEKDLKFMWEAFYRQSGYLKLRQDSCEVILRPFGQKNLEKDAQAACRRFNQSGIDFPPKKRLHISIL